MGEIVTLKAEIEKLEQKIIETNVRHTAAMKEMATGNRGKMAEDAALLKEYLKMNQSLVDILKGKNNQGRVKVQLESLIKKAPEDRRELLCLIKDIIPSQAKEQDNTTNVYSSELDKLLEAQSTAQKNVKYLYKLRTSYETEFSHIENQGEKKAYQHLAMLSDVLINL